MGQQISGAWLTGVIRRHENLHPEIWDREGSEKPKLGRFPVMTIPEARARAGAMLSQAANKQDQVAPTEVIQKTLQDMMDFYTGDYAAAKQLDLQTVKDALIVAPIYLSRTALDRPVACSNTVTS